MKDFIRKTFGGLKKDYLVRQYFFSILIGGFMLFTFSHSFTEIPRFDQLFLVVVNTAFYPYARWLYETLVGFIFGRTFIVVEGIFFLLAKLATMFICWFLAFIITPIVFLGLWLYFTIQEKNNKTQ